MRAVLRRNRGALLLGGALVAALAVLALVVGIGARGSLDPDGYDPQGAHALAVLLRDRGVQVVRTTDVPGTLHAADSSDTTVFLPFPELLSPEELAALAAAPGTVVVAGSPPEGLGALEIKAVPTGTAAVRDRDPGCDLALAVNAGRARTGGVRYRTADGSSCYGGSLVAVTGRDALLLGSPDALTNAHLGEQGNAALGLGLLGQHAKVVWLVPSPTRAAFGHRPVRSLDDVLPHWVHLVRWQLFVAVVVAALWRGRRLGRVVLERLPVVVRASETVEGHGRLYQAAQAHAAAAGALREAALRSLARLVHDGGRSPDLLVDLVAARTGRDGSAVRALLYGPSPADDAALVRLAADLDALTVEALTREGAGT